MDSKPTNLIKNTIILTTATFISKMLGFIYVIPFTDLVGTQGFALYMYAYRPYTIMLSIATAGIPLAVAKFISKYNQLGDYSTGRRLIKSSILLMSITGIVSFILLYSLSPLLGSILVGHNDSSGNSIEDVTKVMRTVSFALLLVPLLSISRGFFQGHNSMEPTAVSQVIEQVTRILWILIGSFVVIRLFNGNVSTAVNIATLGAMIGAISGLIVIYYFWIKKRPDINKLKDDSKIETKMPLSKMYKELFSYSVPFVLVGLAIPFYQLADTFMINYLYTSVGYSLKEAETINSVLGLTQTLILIPVSLATALSLSLIPSITSLYIANDFVLLKKQVNQIFLMLFFVTTPAVIGLSLLSTEAYITIFGVNNSHLIGGTILQYYSPAALFFALFSVTAAILQGINRQNVAIIALFLGLTAKVIFNILLVQPFGELGPVFSTYIGYTISIFYNFKYLKKELKFSFKPLLKKILLIALIVTVMIIIVAMCRFLLLTNLQNSLRIDSTIICVTCSLIGILTYLFLSMKSKLLLNIFEKEPKVLKKIFKC